MAILFASTEADSFKYVNVGGDISTNVPDTYTQYTLAWDSDRFSDPGKNVTAAFGDTATIYFSVMTYTAYVNPGSQPTSYHTAIRIRDSNNNVLCGIGNYANSNTGDLKITSIVNTTASPNESIIKRVEDRFMSGYGVARWWRFDGKVSVSGDTLSIKLWLDNQLVLDFSDTEVGRTWGLPNNIYLTTWGVNAVVDDGWYVRYPMVLVATTPTMGMRIKAIRPNATGTYSDWTGANTDINELGYDGSTFITPTASSQRSSFTTTPASKSITNSAVNSVVVLGIGDDTTYTINPFLRIASTNYNGAGFGFSGSNSVKFVEYTTDPSTGNPWTGSGVDSISEIGVTAV